MDASSQLLSLGRSHVELDVRCLLDGLVRDAARPAAARRGGVPPGAGWNLPAVCRRRTHAATL
ncbi:Transcriptional regulator, AraC family [Burkholderia anthina]|nr:Transcriptional regulator, AraC family [Burkholderia anthina]